MADVTLTVGMQQRYKVGGLRADGVTPAPLDPNTAFTFPAGDGAASIRQSTRSFDEIVIGMPASEAVGGVSHVNVETDGDPGPGLAAIDLAISVTATRDMTQDAKSAGLTPVGPEEALDTPD